MPTFAGPILGDSAGHCNAGVGSAHDCRGLSLKYGASTNYRSTIRSTGGLFLIVAIGSAPAIVDEKKSQCEDFPFLSNHCTTRDKAPPHEKSSKVILEYI